MGIFSTLGFVVGHPLNKGNKVSAIARFAKWQLVSRVFPHPVVYPFTERSRLIIKRGMTGATGNIYTGLHEYADMFFLLHFLRKEDLFIDIGANVGTYTVLAGAHVGAKVISIEPVPSTYTHLGDNIRINNVAGNVTALNIALGSENGYINFTSGLDTVNHVATKDDKDIIQVRVETMNDLLQDQPPSLIKIDVEGFETEVLRGADNVLRQKELKAIIIELNGSGKRYGYDEGKIHQQLLDHGFSPFTYDPVSRSVRSVESFGNYNTIYLRDRLFVEDRLAKGEKVNIARKSI